jgi:hypothetical protein
MKTLIRTGVFETNSSSTHSISINNDQGRYESITPDDDGVLRVFTGEFGWEEERYNDARTKLSYMMIYVRDWCGTMQEHFSNILKQVVKEHTLCEDVVLMDKDGYIDHQSVEDNDYHYLFQDPLQLKNFIFNPGSTLTTDNDNH